MKIFEARLTPYKREVADNVTHDTRVEHDGLWRRAAREVAAPERTPLEDPYRKVIDELAMRMRRRSRGALIRNTFVCGAPGRVPPLARLAGIRGRGGGEVALKLYLALLWVSSGGEHTTEFESARWAQVLTLPPSTGARRVRRAIDTLREQNLIKVKVNDGKAPTITLLHDSGSGKEYRPPKGRGEGDRYFSVAPELWTTGLIQGLDTAAVAMLLILSEEARGKDRPQWWSPRVFNERFHISSDTRTKGVKKLRESKLVVERNLVLTTSPSNKSIFDPSRRRKAYLLVNEAKQPEPDLEISIDVS